MIFARPACTGIAAAISRALVVHCPASAQCITSMTWLRESIAIAAVRLSFVFERSRAFCVMDAADLKSRDVLPALVEDTFRDRCADGFRCRVFANVNLRRVFEVDDPAVRAVSRRSEREDRLESNGAFLCREGSIAAARTDRQQVPDELQWLA